MPWDPEFRNTVAIPGGRPLLEVGKVQDFDLDQTKIRAFSPPGEAPASGWPLFIFFHGGEFSPTWINFELEHFVSTGGWTLGGKASESSFATRMCIREWDRHWRL